MKTAVSRAASPIRVLLADDHAVALEGMRLMLTGLEDVEIVGCADSPDTLHRMLNGTGCDVLVTDLVMPGGQALDGLTMIDTIRRSHPALRMVVTVSGASTLLVSQLLAMGAIGVLSKRDSAQTFQRSIYEAHAGCLYLGERLRVWQDDISRPGRMLTWREMEVLRLIAQGIAQVQIAQRWGKATQTVSLQKQTAMNKLGIKDLADLPSYMSRHGLSDFGCG